jgi:hypothetical protein
VCERVTGWSASFAHWSARRWLRALHDEVGAAGLAAAAALPGLGAAVDQHSAAVRDSVTVGLESSAAVAGLVLLAGYGGAPDRQGWARADWITVRLVAVCALAREHGKAAITPPRLDDLPPAVQA